MSKVVINTLREPLTREQVDVITVQGDYEDVSIVHRNPSPHGNYQREAGAIVEIVHEILPKTGEDDEVFLLVSSEKVGALVAIGYENKYEPFSGKILTFAEGIPKEIPTWSRKNGDCLPELGD